MLDENKVERYRRMRRRPPSLRECGLREPSGPLLAVVPVSVERAPQLNLSGAARARATIQVCFELMKPRRERNAASKLDSSTSLIQAVNQSIA